MCFNFLVQIVLYCAINIVKFVFCEEFPYGAKYTIEIENCLMFREE